MTNAAAASPDTVIAVKGSLDHMAVAKSSCFDHFDSKHFVDYIIAELDTIVGYSDHSYYSPCFSWCNIVGLVYQHMPNYHFLNSLNSSYSLASFLILHSPHN